MIENGIIPLLWFACTGFLWAVTIYYSHRLGRNFIKKYPDVASREIPYAFQHIAHPEKAFYFLRRKARDFLRNDRELFKQRQRFVWLSVLSVIAPFAGFGALFAYAMLHR